MASSVRNPLLLPEIAQLIATFSGYREQRNLAYTSRRLFRPVIPIIWEEIRGVEILMKLIPGVKIVVKFEAEKYYKEVKVMKHMIVDERTLVEDWARYWLYAPFVRHLALISPTGRHPTRSESLHVEGWRFLFMKLKGDALLPNLRSLDAACLYKFPHLDRLAWFALFSSPCLQKLHLDDAPTHTPDGPARALWLLLDTVLESSPSDLSGVPLPRDGWHPSEHTLASLRPDEYQEGFHWFKNIPSLTGLQDLQFTLAFSTETLWDEFYILGYLPLLENLELYCGLVHRAREPERYSDTPLPTSLFPSLRRFCIAHPASALLLHWLWNLKPMVSGLSSARIKGGPYGINRKELISSFSQPMSQNCPNLTDFRVYLTPNWVEETTAMEVVCELLSVVSLKTLEIECPYEVDLGYPGKYLGNTFPHLRRLRLSFPLLLFGFRSLPKVAKAFPNLEYFSIHLSVLEGYSYLDCSRIEHVAFQSIEINITESTFNDTPNMTKEIWRKLQRFLKAIWPNASISAQRVSPIIGA